MEIKENISSIIEDSGFYYAKGVSIDDLDFKRFCEEFGDVVDYKFGGVLDINSQNPLGGNQFSCRAMCLHQDGVLNDIQPDLIFLYCTSSEGLIGGEHIFSDTEKVLECLKKENPQEYNLLKKHKVKYFSNLENYYKEDIVDDGIEKPAIVSHPFNGRDVFFMALNDRYDVAPNYRARFEGMSESESDILMNLIDQICRKEELMQTISFDRGDLLVMDNYKMIHGRNAYNEGAKRNVKRIQVKRNVHNNRGA